MERGRRGRGRGTVVFEPNGDRRELSPHTPLLLSVNDGIVDNEMLWKTAGAAHVRSPSVSETLSEEVIPWRQEYLEEGLNMEEEILERPRR